MSTLICFSLSSTLRPRSVVASLALHELESGSPVAVLDVSRFSYVRQDLPPSWFARFCGQTVHHSALEEFFSQRGVPTAPLTVGEPSRALPDHVEREFQDGVWSELVTYVRSDSPNEKSLFVRISAKRIADAARPPNAPTSYPDARRRRPAIRTGWAAARRWSSADICARPAR